MEQQPTPSEQPAAAEQEAPAYYEALIPINVGGVRAYNPGDKVPAENVAVHGYEVGVEVRAVTAQPEQASDGQPVIGTVPEEISHPEGSKTPTAEPQPQPVAEPAAPAEPDGEQAAPKRRR